MAVKDQFEFFKAVYDVEVARQSRLTGRANLYFTIISFFLAAIVFKFEDVKNFLFLFHVPMWTYLVVALALTVALIATLWAVMIRRYQGVCDAESIASSLENYAIEDDFWKDRIVEFGKATKKNAAQNQSVAGVLRVAAYGIVAAAVLQGIIIVVALVMKIESYNTPHSVAPPTRTGGNSPMKKNPPTKTAPPSKTTSSSSSSKATAPPVTKQAPKTMADRLRDVPDYPSDESDNSG